MQRPAGWFSTVIGLMLLALLALVAALSGRAVAQENSSSGTPTDATPSDLTDADATQPASPVLKPGQPAPGFQLLDVHGQPHTLQELRGNAVLVMFWVSWIPACVHMGDAHLARILGSLRDVPFRVVTIGGSYRDTPERQAAMVDERGWDWLSLHDPGLHVTRRWGARSWGWLVLIDEGGRVVQVGDSHESLAQIEAWLSRHFNRTIATAGHQGDAEADAAIGGILRAVVIILVVLVIGTSVRQKLAARRPATTTGMAGTTGTPTETAT